MMFQLYMQQFEGTVLFTFSKLQIEGVLRLHHLTAGRPAFQLVSQFLQLDIEMHLILSTWKLGTAGA